MVKRGILGGTFDPVHRGHLAIAESARHALELEEVLLVPASQNPLKQEPVATAVQRLQMSQLLAEEREWLSVSDVEVTRNGPSFTIDTAEELSLVMPGQYWVIIGSDAMLGIERWKRWQQLAALCRFAVIMRQGEDFDSFLSRLPEQVRPSCDHVPMTPVPISSSRFRDEFLMGRPVKQLVTEKVWEYIEESGLYQ